MTVNTKDLSREVDFVTRFVAAKTTIPILANIQLSASNHRLSLCATDLETMGFSHVVSMKPHDQPDTWAVTVPAKKLAAYLKKIKEPQVTLEYAASHKLTLTHGANSVSFDGMSTESFPEPPGFPALAFEFVRPEQAIPQVSIAISKDESRFTLNGALLHIQADRADLIATDGHRLSKLSVDLTPLPGTALAPARYLIPLRALKELQRMDGGRTWMGANEDHLSFVTVKRAILARKLTGNFPDYDRVMPKEYAHSFLVDANVLAQALDRVKLFADERSGAVLFKTGQGTLSITAQTVENGNGAGTIPAAGADPGLSMGFNCKYILEYLAVTKDQPVRFSYNDPTNAATFTGAGGGAEYLVMPLRM